MADERMTAWFCQKIEQNRQGMYVLALSLLGRREDAEDAVQNALLLAYEHLDGLRSFEKFRPWLFRILSRECTRLARLRTDDEDIDALSIPAPQGDDDVRLSLWQTVERLPPIYRSVVVLFYYEDMSIADMAKTLELTQDTVKKRLSRGREALRKEDFA